MLDYEITSIAGRYKRRRRVGRGNAAGSGKTSGRGHKGRSSRAGSMSFGAHEGGQMPLFRRLPKRGFNNKKFAVKYEIVNVSQLEGFEEGAVVGVEQLSSAGLVDGFEAKIKILGDGEITKKLQVSAHKFSKNAQQKIVALGGTATII